MYKLVFSLIACGLMQSHVQAQLYTHKDNPWNVTNGVCANGQCHVTAQPKVTENPGPKITTHASQACANGVCAVPSPSPTYSIPNAATPAIYSATYSVPIQNSYSNTMSPSYPFNYNPTYYTPNYSVPTSNASWPIAPPVTYYPSNVVIPSYTQPLRMGIFGIAQQTNLPQCVGPNCPRR